MKEEMEICLEIFDVVYSDLEPWTKYVAYNTYLGHTRSEFMEAWEKLKRLNLYI